MRSVAEKGLKQFLLKHESDIEKAGKFNEEDDEMSLLYLVFFEEFNRFPGHQTGDVD